MNRSRKSREIPCRNHFVLIRGLARARRSAVDIVAFLIAGSRNEVRQGVSTDPGRPVLTSGVEIFRHRVQEGESVSATQTRYLEPLV